MILASTTEPITVPVIAQLNWEAWRPNNRGLAGLLPRSAHNLPANTTRPDSNLIEGQLICADFGSCTLTFSRSVNLPPLTAFHLNAGRLQVPEPVSLLGILPGVKGRSLHIRPGTYTLVVRKTLLTIRLALEAVR